MLVPYPAYATMDYDKDKVKAKAAVKGFTVGGDHGIQKKTIELAKQ